MSYRMILGIGDAQKHDNVFTLISFLIYKEWLLMSLKNKSGSNCIVLNFYKLNLRMKMYKSCNNFPERNIENILRIIEKFD